ncbi:hypothetical protein ACPOL_3641 [Acidisarcina polymorpha]|uniref:IPT/TIG domain-containing protein n=2 Tax=Acidisarcina polymorpha TaxID=2211140 RepID=A0A2Z5G284_9BACT|nr:hypothetical protein ACPOL_3641 [Acidisarcina polymorpha]
MYSQGQQTIQITATNPDGTNTGTARVGVPVSLVATVSAGPYQVVNWSITGGGSVSATSNSAATYTPPLTMPSSTSVTITAYLHSAPSVTQSYALSLIYPVPSVTSTAIPQAEPGYTYTNTNVNGVGFVPGTVVSANGAALTTTYKDWNHVSVTLPTPATASGFLTLQAANPTPGGGSGASYNQPVQPTSIVLTATNPDGTNTGTARLGVNVNVAAVVSGSVSKTVTWSVTGSGSISGSGVYTPPSSMPTNGNVTITATLTSNPAVSTPYPLTLVNPAPVITSMSPLNAPAGSTIAVTLTGHGFVPGTTIVSNVGSIGSTTYQSPTSVVAQLTLPASATGNLSLQAQNPAPGGGLGAALQSAISTLQITATNAAGTNTGTAQLGVPVNLTATVANSQYAVISWTLQGAGTLVRSGNNGQYATYTAPTTMPSNTNVSITASLSSYSALATTYAISLGNPIPSVASATPTQLLTGGTQSVALAGSGFMPGTVVLFNGASLPTTYTNYNSATVQVPVAANATGTLSLQVQNPSPGGGTGNTFTESVMPNTISLTATDADGTNTGTAELSTNVSMVAAVSGSEQTAVNWSVAGAGSISSNGVYTAPAALPTNTAVTITAALASNPAITASYSLNVINPIAVISGSSPSLAPAGESTAITFTGTGFVPSTVVLVNNTPVPTTYQSATSVVAEVTVSPSDTGNLSITAQNPAPGGGTSLFYLESISASLGVRAAARILDQTTFGPTSALISHVQQEGIDAWLSEQFNTPQTVLAPVYSTHPSYCSAAEYCTESEWYQAVLTGNDQLRQRVAFALSELYVISAFPITGVGVTPYINMLAADAFTNWHQIMTDVTLSPAMGIYLDMLDSHSPTGTEIADENYAREFMQLFNMGIYLLNQDGSLQLDGNGNPIPAYTEAQVEAFARAFTGWTYANADGSTPSSLIGVPNYFHPMVAVEADHDTNPKTLLNDTDPTSYKGTTLPSGQTAEQDVQDAITNVFNHPNVPPFVSKQLIQHLVTSMPSPGYISRVASVFTNDGNGVRGNMTAVLNAIFTDPEARAGDTDASADVGKLREPILWLTAVMRGLGVTNTDPNNYYDQLSTYLVPLGERPFAASSVFNFFSPSYVIPGTTLNAPEFGIENTASVATLLTLADRLMMNKFVSFNVDLSATSSWGQMASTPSVLVDALGTLFMHAEMDPNIRASIISEVSSVTDLGQRVRLAVYLVITASQYKVSH